MSEAKIFLTAVDQTRQAFESAKAGLQGLHVSATAVKATLAGLGVTTAALGLGSMVGRAIEAADQLNKLSQRTGVATEKLSELQFAAKLSDVSTDSLTVAMTKLNVSIADGISGDKSKAEAFRNLGVSLKDARGHTITADQALLKIADTFSVAKDGAVKAQYGNELFGKSFDELIPLLNQGGRAIQDTMAKANRMGLTISTEFAQQAEEFNDNLTILRASSDKLAISMGGDLVSALGSVAAKMAEAAEKGGKLKGIMAGLDELGNKAFDWEGNALRKGIQNAEEDIAHLRAQLSAPVVDLFGKKGEIEKDLNEKIALLQKLRQEYYKFTDAAGAGRGVVNPPMANPAGKSELKPLSSKGASISEYQKLNEEMQRAASLAQAELEWGGKLSESEKFRTDAVAKVDAAYKKGEITLKERTKLLAQLNDVTDAQKKNELRDSEYQQALAIAQERQRQRNEEYKAGLDLTREAMELQNKQTAAARDYLEQVQFEISLIGMDNQQREVAIAMRELEKQGIKEGTLAWEEFNQKIKDAVATRSALQQSVERFREIWQSVDQTAHDVFVNIFEGGSNVFKKLGQALKASLLDLLYQMTLKKWIINIAASVTGTPAGVVQSAVGNQMGGFGDLLSMGKGGFPDASTWSLSNVGSMGSGLSGFLGFGGAAASGAGSSAAASAFALSDSVYAGSSLAAGAGAGAGIGSAMATAIPYIGWAIAAYQLISSMTQGETRGGGQYGYSFNGTDVLNPRRGRTLGASGIGATFLEGPSGGDSNSAAAKSALNATVDTINSILKGVGSDVKLTQFQGGYESSEKGRGGVFTGGTFSTGATFGESGKGDNYAGTLYESTSAKSGDLQTIFANFVTDNKQSVIQAVQALAGEIPKTLSDLVANVNAEGLSDADAQALVEKITGIVQSVQSLDGVLGALPADFDALKSASFDMKAALVDAAGGVQNLTTQLGGFSNDFYSDAEKKRALASQVATSLTAGGLSMSAEQVFAMTREQYKNWVRYAISMGDAGTRTLATLLSVEQAFNQLKPATEAGVNGAMAALTRAVGAERQSAQAARDAAQQRASEISSVFDALKAGVDDLYGQVDATVRMRAGMAKQFIEQAIGAAQSTGYLPDAKQLQDAIGAAMQDVKSTVYTSVKDREFAQLVLAGQLSQLKSVAGGQLTDAQRQLQAADEQINRLDQILASAQQQVDALAGVDNSVKSVAAALGDLAVAIAGEQGAGAPPTPAPLAAMPETAPPPAAAPAPAPAPEEPSIWVGGRFRVSQAAAFADGGWHEGGAALIGERGPELAMFPPSRIFNARDTQAMLGGSADVVRALEAVEAVLLRLERTGNESRAILQGQRGPLPVEIVQ